MISFHRIAALRARHSPDTNYVVLTMVSTLGDETNVNLFFGSPRLEDSVEESSRDEATFAAAFAEAINSIPPMPTPESSND